MSAWTTDDFYSMIYEQHGYSWGQKDFGELVDETQKAGQLSKYFEDHVLLEKRLEERGIKKEDVTDDTLRDILWQEYATAGTDRSWVQAVGATIGAGVGFLTGPVAGAITGGTAGAALAEGHGSVWQTIGGAGGIALGALSGPVAGTIGGGYIGARLAGEAYDWVMGSTSPSPLFAAQAIREFREGRSTQEQIEEAEQRMQWLHDLYKAPDLLDEETIGAIFNNPDLALQRFRAGGTLHDPLRKYEQAIREGNTDAAAKALESMKNDPRLTGAERSLMAQLPDIASMGADRAIPIIRYVAGKNIADSGPQEAKEGFEESVAESNEEILDAWYDALVNRDYYTEMGVPDNKRYEDLTNAQKYDLLGLVSEEHGLSKTQTAELAQNWRLELGDVIDSKGIARRENLRRAARAFEGHGIDIGQDSAAYSLDVLDVATPEIEGPLGEAVRSIPWIGELVG